MHEFFNEFFDWSLMGDSFTLLLKGFKYTIYLSLLGGALSLIWGLVLATLRQLPKRWFFQPIRWLTIAYIDVFRGIPLLVLLVMINASLGAFNQTGTLPSWLAVPDWLGLPYAFWYSVLGLVLCYGAYMAEVYRAGIESVPRGQMEAARSLGMGHGQAMRFVIVPQAVRTVVPPLLNDFVALMKDTSLASVISLADVLKQATAVQSTTYNASTITLAALMYLVVTLPLIRVVDHTIKGQQAKFQRGLP